MALTWFAIVKLVHVLLATTWVGAVIYDWMFNLRRFRRIGGAKGLGGYVAETSPAIPFWATVGFGTLIFGFETARRAYGTTNPFEWVDIGQGAYIFASLWLVIASLALGIAQVPKSAKVLAERGDDAASQRMLSRIHVLGAIEVALLVVVVALMVLAGVGGV